MTPKIDPGGSKMGPRGSKMASRRPPGAFWSPGRAQEPPKGGKGGVRNRKQIHLSRPGGLQKSSWTIFQRLEPPPGRFCPPFWEALGAPGGSFWRLLAESPKTLDFEYLPRENLDFEGSGRSFFYIVFSIQNSSEKRRRPEIGPNAHIKST